MKRTKKWAQKIQGSNPWTYIRRTYLLVGLEAAVGGVDAAGP